MSAFKIIPGDVLLQGCNGTSRVCFHRRHISREVAQQLLGGTSPLEKALAYSSSSAGHIADLKYGGWLLYKEASNQFVVTYPHLVASDSQTCERFFQALEDEFNQGTSLLEKEKGQHREAA
jgi:hypothetical protein